MTDLTAEELASVARECANNIYYWENPGDWTPSFDSDDTEDRSEALAVVEWLTDELMNNFVQSSSETKRRKNGLLKAIADKDTNALMSMVLELRTKP